jgi:hypothetical protein
MADMEFVPTLSAESLDLLRSLYDGKWRYSFAELADGRVGCLLLQDGIGPGVSGVGATGDEAVRLASDKARLHEIRGPWGGRRRRR